jgi:hypothetical protein
MEVAITLVNNNTTTITAVKSFIVQALGDAFALLLSGAWLRLAFLSLSVTFSCWMHLKKCIFRLDQQN